MPEIRKASTEAEEARRETQYWITPVSGRDHPSGLPDEVIRELVVDEKRYAFRDSTPNKQRLDVGDWICFYASGKGVIAHAKVVTRPERRSDSFSKDYPWTFVLDDCHFYPDCPTRLNTDLRTRLDALKDFDPKRAWGWFVVRTRRLTKHDFEILTQGRK